MDKIYFEMVTVKGLSINMWTKGFIALSESH